MACFKAACFSLKQSSSWKKYVDLMGTLAFERKSFKVNLSSKGNGQPLHFILLQYMHCKTSFSKPCFLLSRLYSILLSSNPISISLLSYDCHFTRIVFRDTSLTKYGISCGLRRLGSLKPWELLLNTSSYCSSSVILFHFSSVRCKGIFMLSFLKKSLSSIVETCLWWLLF